MTPALLIRRCSGAVAPALGEVAHRVQAGQVEHLEAAPGPRGGRVDVGGDRPAGVGLARQRDHSAPGLGQRARRLDADAGGRAGDDGRAARAGRGRRRPRGPCEGAEGAR